MRIALVTDWFHPRVGGIEGHVQSLASKLRARGHDARVITPWPGEAEVNGIPVDRIPVRLVPGLHVSLSPRALVRGVEAALGARSYDIVHGHMSFGSTATVAVGYVAARMGVPSVGTYHSILRRLGWVHVMAAPLLGWRRWPFRVTAVSEAVARDLRWIMPERSVEILPNAIAPEDWPRCVPDPVPGALRVVATARLQRRKRVDALVTVVSRVRRLVASSTDVTLEVLGDGPERGALERRIRKGGLAGAVRLLGEGEAEAVRALLARGDVFINAADQESFGLAALEALSAGLPVVARREGGVGSFIRHGMNGLLVDSDDEMVRTLVELATDGTRLATLRNGAAEGIAPAYTWNVLVDRHLALYEDMLREAVVRG